MRIIHLLGSGKLAQNPDKSSVSGLVRAVLEIAKHQVLLGHTVSVLAVGDRNLTSIWEGVQLKTIPGWNWARIAIGRQTFDLRQHLPILFRLLLMRKADVVHGHNYSYLRGLRARVRVVHFHVDPLYDVGGQKLGASDIQMILKTSDVQIAVSQFIERQLENISRGSGRFVLVKNGVDVAEFDPARAPTLAVGFRTRHDISEGAFAFGFAGAIIPTKGVLELATAFAKVASRWSNVHLVVVGDFDLWEGHYNKAGGLEYVELVKSATKPFPNRVHFVGKLAKEDMKGFYAGIDVLVMPSTSPEAFPLVPLEAMAMGKPVVATRIGGLPEIIDETRGWLVPAGDVGALAEAMVEALDGQERSLPDMGSAASAFAKKQTWESAVENIMNAYNSVLGGEAPPPSEYLDPTAESVRRIGPSQEI